MAAHGNESPKSYCSGGYGSLRRRRDAAGAAAALSAKSQCAFEAPRRGGVTSRALRVFRLAEFHSGFHYFYVNYLSISFQAGNNAY